MKITKDNLQVIRRHLQEGTMSTAQLARDYNVTYGTIWNIKKLSDDGFKSKLHSVTKIQNIESDIANIKESLLEIKAKLGL